jgi:hypothetical protein
MKSMKTSYPLSRNGYLGMVEVLFRDLGDLLTRAETTKSTYLNPDSWRGDVRALYQERLSKWDFY